MTVKTFTWNPTVRSFVLYRLQSSPTPTGVKLFRNRVINTVQWQVRITATEEGFTRIAGWVAECLADPRNGVTVAS